MDNQRKSKEIKIHKIDFKNAKRFVPNKKNPHKKNSYTPGLYKEKKNSIQNISQINLINKIEEKYAMIDNNNLIKAQKRDESPKKLFYYKFNSPYKKIKEDKNNNCNINETPINVTISQTNEDNRKKSSKELKRCKTVCNNNKKILKEQENDLATRNNNINMNKAKKGKNGKKEIKLGKKKTNNKSQKNSLKIEEKGKIENLTKNIKNKFLCCFLL